MKIVETKQCDTCQKYVEKSCNTKAKKDKCLFNKLQPTDKVEPIKADYDYGKNTNS